MRILVLGSAAGGGSPQWNCNCRVCQRVRDARDKAAPPRTQVSLAVAADAEAAGPAEWLLINASPDLRQQLLQQPALHPQRGLRHNPFGACVVTSGDVDHIAGLLTLREGASFSLYASAPVRETLRPGSVFGVLPEERVPRRPLPLGAPTRVVDGAGRPLGLTVEAFAVPGKVALYAEDATNIASIGETTPDTIGLKVTEEESGASFFVVTSCARLSGDLADRLRGARLLFFDGTLWTNDELVAQGLTEKTGQRMGHMSISGADGSLAKLAPLGIEEKIFIHLNNSNPVLLADSAERRTVEEEGWRVAHDGMTLRLGG